MSKRSKIWILAASGLVFAQTTVSLVLPQSFGLAALSDITQFLLLLSGTLAFLPNVRATHGRIRLFWALMTLGLAFWLAYQLLWVYFEVLKRQEVPNLFAGDVILFLHIVPMMAALALQPHVEQDERTARLGSLDFALLLVWWLYLYVFAVMPWQYASSNETAYGHNLNIVYLTEKVVFLGAVATVWWHSQGSWKTVYAHWFGANLTYALSSYVANWAIARNLYYSGSLYDVPLAISMAWVTVTSLVAYDRSPKQQPARRSGSHGVWVARLGMLTTFSLPLFAAYSVFDTSAPPGVRSFRLAVTLGATMVMGAMVFLRQHLLDRELLGLLRTSEHSVQDLRRLQAQLVQSEKLASLGQLVGGAAHELNNPLTAMLGYTDLLTTMPLREEQRALLERINHQAQRAKILISNLISFAKQVPAEKGLVDVNALAQTAVKLCRSQTQDQDIRIHTDFGRDLPQILGDSNLLMQVCLNVIKNALYAMKETGGTLSVRTQWEKPLIVLEFSDDGSGAGKPERVSDPFYATRPIGQDPGLGLSACYGIIQEHNGRILCQNRAHGGATFRIELPVGGEMQRRMTPRDADSPQLAADELISEDTLVFPPDC